MDLNVEWPFAEVLKQAEAAKEKVEIHMRSGKTFKGAVKGVGSHTAVITALEGKEFFSAIVKLDDVSAVEVRTKK